MTLPASLRKAAVLVSTLDEREAERLLASMSPDEAAKVRSALVALDEVPAAEQRQVLADFFRQQSASASNSGNELDVALELSLDVERQVALEPPPEGPAAGSSALAFLERVSAGALAALLRGEHPQTAAVVIAQLSPERAALVLEGLPPSQATDALERMAWLGEIAPEVMADLARELRERLATHLRPSAADASALANISAVLAAMGDRQRQRTLDRLAARNTTLSAQLGAQRPRAASVDDAGNVVAFRYRLGPPLNASGVDATVDGTATDEEPAPRSFAAAV